MKVTPAMIQAFGLADPCNCHPEDAVGTRLQAVLDLIGPSLTDVLAELVAANDPKRGNGLIIDDAARKIRAMMLSAIEPAKRESIPEAEQDQTDPHPGTWRYLPGEWEREIDARLIIHAAVNQAVRNI